MRDPLKIAILISGRGSNMQKLVVAAKKLNVEIVLVASDKEAAGITWAKEKNLKTACFLPSDYGGRRPGQELALADAILSTEADYIFLAGYMAILSEDFVQKFSNKIINIHPSLLPKYKGLDTHRRVLETDDTVHGATVHLVTAALDDGPILLQGTVPVLDGDDEDALSTRTLEIEHLIYPEVLSALSTGMLTISGPVPRWNAEFAKKLCADNQQLSIGN